MNTSTRKIVAGLLSFAMVLTLVVGLSVAPASAQTANFTRSLTVGSTGADVTALQTILYQKGFLMVSPTGYFGSLTRAAVSAWQASVNVPNTGYFGPLSRAAINGTVTTGGTTGGTPGCPSGAMYNYMTGALCGSTGGSTTGTGVEGSLTVTQSAAPANNSNVTSNSDVPVYGVDLKAQLGDVTVQRLDLDVSVYNSGYENPGNFVNTIKVWNGSTLVKSWSVGTADFIQGTTSTDYYVRLSGINFVVPAGTTKTLTVSISSNGGIDVSRIVMIRGYGTNSLLATSGNNITSYYDVSGITRTHTFVKPGTATLTVAADANNILSQTNRVNPSASGALNATLQTFTVKSETGDSKITSITATSNATTVTGPTALYLYDGSTLLASQSVAATANANVTVTFNNLSLVVPKDTTKVLTISGDFQTTTTNGTVASTTVTSTTYQKPNGTSAVVSSSVQGNAQYFYTVSPQWTLLSATAATTGSNGTTGSTTGLTATFILKAKPVGGSMVLPTTSDFGISVASSTSANATTTVDSVQVSGSPTSLAEGGEYTVTITKNLGQSSFSNLSLGTITSEWFTINNASSTINGQAVNQTWGFNTFKTNPVSFVR